ncbi:MAG: hypothetical protein RLZZ234_73 [Candidatus Parcubacteria bacterium]
MYMYTHKRSTVGAFGAGIVLGVCMLSLYGAYRLAAFTHAIEETERMLVVSFIDRAAEADSVEQTAQSTTEVRDCTSRARFELLLSAPPPLRIAERTELDTLFAECAPYHAALKSYYVRELRDLAEAYASNEKIAATIRARAPRTTEVQTAFARIVKGERERAVLMEQQVLLQKELLALSSGKVASRTSSAITSESTHITERLGVLNTELDAERAMLADLK